MINSPQFQEGSTHEKYHICCRKWAYLFTANITVRADQEDYNRGLLDARIQYAQQLQEQYNSNSRTSPLIHSTSYNQTTPIRTDIIRNIPSNLINYGISYGSIRLSDEFQNQMTKW